MKILSLVTAAYPTVQLSKEIVNLWTTMLLDVSFDNAVLNMERHIKTSKYAPTIAEIRGNLSPLSVDRLRQETQERFRLMDSWKENACPRPLLKEGEQP